MKSRVLLAAVLASACFALPSGAQTTTTKPPSASLMPQSLTPSETTQLDRELAKLSLQNSRQAMGKTPEQLKAMDIADAKALTATIQFPCEVTDAALLLEGSESVNGSAVKTRTFEAACANGLGYFLVAHGKDVLSAGMTCFAAKTTHDADVKEHRSPNLTCNLLENKDAKTMAANILLRGGKSCQVRDTRWIGLNVKGNTDYMEIACNDGNGFIVASPLPGSTLKPQIVNCREAALQGIPCKLTDTGKVITTQTFKDALAQHQVACDASDVRVIGKETVAKRHVVEFACKQPPEGLVAFIPLDDSTAPFEAVDCASAAKRGLVCKLTPAK